MNSINILIFLPATNCTSMFRFIHFILKTSSQFPLFIENRPKSLFLVPKLVPNRLKMAKMNSKNILIFLAAKNCTSMMRFIHFLLKPSSQFPLFIENRPKSLFSVPKLVPNRLKMAKMNSENILIFLTAKNCTSMLRFIHFLLKPSSQFPLFIENRAKSLFLVPKLVPNRLKMAKINSENILIFLAAKNSISMLLFIHFLEKISS